MNAAGLNCEIQIEILFILRALIVRARSDHQHLNFGEFFPPTGVSSFAGDTIYPGTEDNLVVQLTFAS